MAWELRGAHAAASTKRKLQKQKQITISQQKLTYIKRIIKYVSYTLPIGVGAQKCTCSCFEKKEIAKQKQIKMSQQKLTYIKQ